MTEDSELTEKIKLIVEGIHPKPSEISLAIINLKNEKIAGYNMDHFIYPASIYKVFVAAEILRQVHAGERCLEDVVRIEEYNAVDTRVRFFPSGTHADHRPVLKCGDLVTLEYLIDLMLTRSDNTAANVLIDIADRENVNKNIILPNDWGGSEVTRKFLDRLREKKDYRLSSITVSNARHFAEFFYKVERGQLVNEWVSQKLKEYMYKWNRDRRKGLYIPEFQSYYRKGGWLEINGYKWNIWRGIKALRAKGYAVIKYAGDAGVAQGHDFHYVVCVLTQIKTKWPWQSFDLTTLSKKINQMLTTHV